MLLRAVCFVLAIVAVVGRCDLVVRVCVCVSDTRWKSGNVLELGLGLGG